MTKRITRRQFFRYTGLVGTAVAVSGCTINLQRYETLEPYRIPPEDALPGQNIWYASTCRQCPAGCGIKVRVSNGRARKIEGNPEHPLNLGKVCARGQAGLQLLYNPDRLRNAVRQAQRGSAKFEPIHWDQALAQVAERVRGARPGAVAFYGRLGADSLAAIVNPFIQAMGGPAPVYYDPLMAAEGRGALAQVTSQLYGANAGLPFFDLAHSDVVFSFGANFSETWLSPVAYGGAYGARRGGDLGKRGYLVQFEPRMSATAAVADEWLPLSPGTEGLVAQAIGQIMVDKNLGGAKESPYAGLFKAGGVDYVSALSGIPSARLEQLAEIFASHERPVAIPGGAMGGNSNAISSMTAVMALNALAGRAEGDNSAFMLSTPPPDPAFVTATPATYDEAKALIERMKAGEVDVLFVDGNPLFELPLASGFAEALARVALVVSFAAVVDETALQADFVLPESSYLESWGYQVVAPPADRPVISSQQPVVTPLYDTQAITDVFLGLADTLGGPAKQALPWKNTVEFMQSVTGTLAGQLAPYSTANPDEVWANFRQYGGWWPPIAQPDLPASAPSLPAGLEVARPDFAGDNSEYPFILAPYPSVALSDGRGANQPWLQETPDPMVTGSWDTWVQISPEIAAQLGVKNDDLIKVISPESEIAAIVYVYPAIRPDVVAVPIGQGHSSYGRYAAGQGSNVLGILSASTDEGGNWAMGATRVRLEALPNQRQVLPRIESNVGVEAAREAGRFPG
ncbi:MAG: molybdopterin-dependent oxidoreductase [Anaerolineae bacterium]